MIFIISERPKVIRRSSLPFGGVSIVYILDEHQLSCPFDVTFGSDQSNARDPIVKQGLALFDLINTRLRLRESVRQASDPLYASILEIIMEKRATTTDLEHLKTRLFYS